MMSQRKLITFGHLVPFGLAIPKEFLFEGHQGHISGKQAYVRFPKLVLYSQHRRSALKLGL